MSTINKMNRRQFIGRAVLGAAGLVMLPSLTSLVGCQPSKASGALRMGFIGLGQQAMGILSGFLNIPDVEVVAGCDVYGVKRERFAKRILKHYEKVDAELKEKDPKHQSTKPSVELYEKYADLLARKDIDVVVIATPDHTHALLAIAACNAKKHVYLEKPLTFKISEGKQLVEAVRKNGVTLAVGSQQRSDPNFQHAVKMVQDGRLGKIDRIYAQVGPPPKPYDLPEETVPADLNWTLWQEPLPYAIHYNSQLNPPITLEPEKNESDWAGWRWYSEVGGGYTTDWGAHMFDIAQWGMGMDKNGPIEIIPAGYNDTKFLTFKYESGIVMTEEPFDEKMTKGVKFWGDKGWIEVSREFFRASDDSLLPVKEEGNHPQYAHYKNFLEAIKQKIDPIASVEIGHSTCCVCTLGNMATELKRPIKWNPKTQSVVNDPEAEKHRNY